MALLCSPEAGASLVKVSCLFQPAHHLSFFPPPTEGFQSWMWRGLTFLLPFLFFGHVSHPWVSPSTPGCPPLAEPQWALHLLNRLPPLQFWQLFNALTLFNLARDPECKEWQVSQGSGRMHGRFPLDLTCPDPASPTPAGAHVRLPLPSPFPRQLFHDPPSGTPEVPQPAAREQEGLS